MNIKQELAKIDEEIHLLEVQKKLTIDQFITERNERDIKTIIRYYAKLMKLYNSKHPELYCKIIVTCFKINTTVCCGICGSVNRIYLSDLLKLWSNGYLYKSYPITNVMLTNSGRWEICFIKNGKMKSINSMNTYLDVHPYYRMPREILGESYKPKDRYSDTSVSDLFYKYSN